MLRPTSAVWITPLFLCVAWAQPQPRVVDAGDATRAPSDAIRLFNGKDMTGWHRADGSAARCAASAGVMTCISGAGDIHTEARFRSAQIHLEFSPPLMPNHKGQMRGNSGVYLQGKYEIQILDSFENPTYVTGMLGSLYGQAAPLVNAARRPGEWQSYDIAFHTPWCGPDGKVAIKGSVTVLLNGVLVQDHVTIQDTSGGCEPGPLMLQDHSGFKNAPVTSMRFRNIWYRPLED
jgi:hypothetical protein